MGIFKNITSKIKEFAPTIGSAIGMFYGGPFGAALGSGIGSLVGGRSAEEALRNAALTGATTYALGGKDFGKGFKFDTSGSPFANREVVGAQKFGFDVSGAPTKIVTDYPAMKGSSIFSKLLPESTMGKLALAGGIGALVSGAEEPEKTTFKQRPFPEGEARLGRGMVDGISFNLNDPEERAEYFRRIREKQGFKDKDDENKDEKDREAFVDPIRAYRGGFFPRPGMQQQMGDTGLNRFGAQISEKIVAPSQEKVREVPAFLDEIKSMAEERFDVQLNGTNQTGGGLNQVGGRLPSFNQNIANLFEQMQNRITRDRDRPEFLGRPGMPERQYVGQDMGGGIDQFGKQMRALPAPVMPISGALMGFGGSPLNASPFGGGQSRTLAGLGSLGNLFMNNGGEVSGPGTGTSDSVPARLSDGEFVLTAKAVRGAGGGDRDLGAARMYDMMSKLERVA